MLVVNRAPKQGRGRATTTKEAERRVVGVGMNETQVLMDDSIYRQAPNTNRMRIHFIFNALVVSSISTKLNLTLQTEPSPSSSVADSRYAIFAQTAPSHHAHCFS
ncbi:hypothetical protein GmHk_18G053452 [Glycine max]|nr:hypothetical protein GmHk_18G053452 [Glycine max]